jgi:CRP/FNR family transcriptional regulator, cyclic AMP receptor protein
MPNLTLIDKAFLLKKTTLFGALDLDLLLSIADKMEAMYYRPADTIFQLDQEAHRMYLILVGQVFIEGGNGVPLAELSAGDFFGDEALFNERRRAYAAHCKTRVELLALLRSHLLAIIHECPSVALFLLTAYSSSLPFRPPKSHKVLDSL